ncbi:MAG: 16S rRNA (cytosine(967)-C(5))-methyltransferase RsmB [Clostridia bacterium]|nr:16S rRNA (cytosine(967)-C(5))-methyltransferase RsmB [Clostridia bacterium]
MTDPVRRGALSLLLRYEAGDGYANLLADGERLSGMEARDRALLIALFYGAVERALTLDHYIGVLAGRSAASLTPHTRAALRLGLYQLLYMNIPPHAAVHATVSLGKDKGERALLNGVLRAAAEAPDRLAPPPAARDLARHLSVAYSIPAATVRYFLGRLGEAETRALLAAFNTRPPLFLRVNTQKLTREALLALLAEAGYEAMPDPMTAHGIRLVGAVPLTALPGYREGYFFVQDAASQLAGELLAPRAGELILDLCACPGGKSFSAALLAGDGARIRSRDIHESKLPLITEGAERLGLGSVTAEVWDATVPDPALCGKVDRIICDVPCSGLGVIAKKPDLRYRGLSSVAELCALSSRILDAAATALRPGGTMVFSTCTLTAEENGEAVTAFLSRHPDFYTEDFTVGGLTSEGGMLTLWPHRHGTDGFFMAKLRRK